jgi:hypothetical protein
VHRSRHRRERRWIDQVPAQLCWQTPISLQTASAAQLWLAFSTHAFMPRPLTHIAHACVAVLGSMHTDGIVLAVPPHCVKQGDMAGQMQSAMTKPMSLPCASGFALPQHSTQVLSFALHSEQSIALAQVPPPVPVLVEVPVPVDVPVDVVMPVDVVLMPVDVVAASVPVDAIVPVVAPPLPPLPPLPVLVLAAPPVPAEVLVVDSEPPQPATATTARTTAPNFQDFMLIPPTTNS